jgi:hypothetical protein
VDTAYISAIAALSGSVIGGLTSLGASWVSHNAQARTQLLLTDKSRRQELYGAFIDEASKLYGDALISNSSDNVEISKFIGLYEMLSRMRILSSQAVIENAEQTIEMIAKIYAEPPKTWRDIYASGNGFRELDILRRFSETCREDLRGRGTV